MEVDITEDIKSKLPIKKSRGRPKRLIMNSKPSTKNTLQELEESNNHRIHYIPSEVTKVKPMIYKGVSLIAKDKAPEMFVNLQTSKYLNLYLDEYLFLDQILKQNDHVKAVLAIAFNFIDAKFNNKSPLVIQNAETNTE